MAQLDAIATQVAGPCEVVGLADCGHRVHRDQPEQAVAAIARFAEKIGGG
jgi:pimeloyl-ACP methyl ester carboxylesterase